MKINFGDYVDIELDEFLKKTDYILEMRFDHLRINPKYRVKFEPIKKYSKYGKLYINGILFETKEFIEQVSEYDYIITIPNVSVLSKAEDMKLALNKHSQVPSRKIDGEVAKPDFDASLFEGKTTKEQLNLVYQYIKNKLKLPHFIHYETLVYALTRDKNSPADRVTNTTESISFIGVNDYVMKAQHASNISSVLIHRSTKKVFQKPEYQSRPSEFDLLYAPIDNRENYRGDIYDKFYDIITNTGVRHE